MRLTQAEWIATEVVTGLLLLGLALLLVVRGSGWVWLFALLAVVLVNGGWTLILARVLRLGSGPWWYRLASQRGVQLAVVGSWYMLFLVFFVPRLVNPFVFILLFLLGAALIGLSQYYIMWAHQHGPQPATSAEEQPISQDDPTQPLEL